MTAPAKPRRKSGPSGPSTPRALRSRPSVEVALAPSLLAEIDALSLRYGVRRTTAIGLAIALALRNGALASTLHDASVIADVVAQKRKAPPTG